MLGQDLSEVAMTVLRRHGVKPGPDGRVSFHHRPEVRAELLELLERHG